MADLLLSGLGLMPAPRRKERTLRLPNDFSLRDFTDEELRSRYRFGRESIEFLSELLCDDLERDTSRNHTLSTTVQVLVALRFFASGNRNTETRKLHQVAIDRRRYTSKQTWIFFFTKGGISRDDCVDGTHIKIQAVHENENDFVNRKGFYAINLQAICKHKGW